MSLSVSLPGGSAGGRSTAVARGEILIDITNSRSAVINASREMGQQIQRNVGGGTEAGVRQADQSLRGLNSTLATTARAFASAFAVQQMVSITQNINRVDALFKTLIGSEEKAADEMERLRKLADEANIPFRDLVSSSTALLPALRNTNADLSKTLLLAARLGELDPVQGQAGATFAIRELLSGTVTSLAARFEIDRKALRDLLAEADGDTAKIIDGLSDLVDGLGLTESAYIDLRRESRDVFAETRSELQETIAFGFTPLLQDGINPAIAGFNDMLRVVREGNPELTQMAVTLTAIAAASKAAEFGGIRGAGQAGALGAAGFVGVQGGIAASRFLAEQGIIDRPDLENVSQGQAGGIIGETAKQVLVLVVDQISKQVFGMINVFKIGGEFLKSGFDIAQKRIETGSTGIELGFLVARDAAYDLRDGFIEVIDGLRDGLAGFLEGLGGFISELPIIGGAGDDLLDAAESLRGNERDRILGIMTRNADDAFRRQDIDQARGRFDEARGREINRLTSEDINRILEEGEGTRRELIVGLAESLGLLEEPLEDITESSEAAAAALAEVDGFSDDMIEAFADFQDDLAEIQDKAHQARLDAEQQHQDAIDDLTASRDLQRKRDQVAEDRRRTKAEKDLTDSIAETHADGANRVAEVVAKGRDEEIKAETQHQRRRIDRLRQLGRDLLNAAASLDARAVFHLLQTNRDRAEDENIARERERTDRRDEQAERLTEIQDETRQRVQALRDQFNESEAERAEQRRIQRQIEDEDFALSLAKLDEQHTERLAQIDRQENEQAALREQKFIEEHNAMIAEQGTHNERMIQVQSQGLQALEQGYANWLLRMQQRTGQTLSSVQVASNLAAPIRRIRIPSFAGGGTMQNDGLAMLHANETVLTPNASRMLSQATGGDISSSGIAQLIAAAGNSRTFQTGDVNISGSQLSPSQMERVIENTLIRIFERLAQ